MPEIQIYQSRDDENALVQRAVERGAILFPDLDYDAPQASVIRNVQEFASFRHATRLYLISHPSYSAENPEFRRVLKKGKPVYYIAQSRGGPYIDFLAGGLPEYSDPKKLLCSSIGYRPKFWAVQVGCTMKVPQALREFYKYLISPVCSDYFRVQVGKVRYFISPCARDQARAGIVLAGLEMLSATDIEAGGWPR